MRFSFVKKLDEHPKRRLMHLLTNQGMQANQQINFLSDGAENVRKLQFTIYSESGIFWMGFTLLCVLRY